MIKRIIGYYFLSPFLHSLSNCLLPSVGRGRAITFNRHKHYITAAGTTDREAVRDALEHLDTHEGLIKTYHQPFTPKQHEALSTDDYHFSRYDANGVIVSVLPTTTVPQ
ncbi:hypothetical protein CCP3SC1_380025 [Gammaproteobacteria bacterium]